MITTACYKSGNDDKSDNNKDKVCSLFKMILVGYVLDHVLDHMILGLVTTALHQNSHF